MFGYPEPVVVPAHLEPLDRMALASTNKDALHSGLSIWMFSILSATERENHEATAQACRNAAGGTGLMPVAEHQRIGKILKCGPPKNYAEAYTMVQFWAIVVAVLRGSESADVGWLRTIADYLRDNATVLQAELPL